MEKMILSGVCRLDDRPVTPVIRPGGPAQGGRNCAYTIQSSGSCPEYGLVPEEARCFLPLSLVCIPAEPTVTGMSRGPMSSLTGDHTEGPAPPQTPRPVCPERMSVPPQFTRSCQRFPEPRGKGVNWPDMLGER